MARSLFPSPHAAACLFATILAAQTPAKVDFRTDIQPLFQQHCIECHGPSQQMGGLRLDRRSSAKEIRAGTTIGPGNAQGSALYLRITGTKVGRRMPPTGPLSPDQVNLIRTWIDQGAEWPDDLSGDKPPAPADPRALRITEALRAGDHAAFARLLLQDPEAVNRRAAGGSTPLMYAALYGDAKSVRELIEHGAEVNTANEAGATALTWAVDDTEKMQVLLEHGADPNAPSAKGVTPFLAALNARPPGPVKLLLDHGAKFDPKLLQGRSVFTPLAAAGSDEAVLQSLIDHAVDPLRLLSGLPLAWESGCSACVDLLMKSPKIALSLALMFAASERDPHALNLLLDHGADAKLTPPGSPFSPLMFAVVADGTAVEKVKALVEHGASVNSKTRDGDTILDIALRQGDPTVVELLRKAGAQEAGLPSEPVPPPKPAPTARAALDRSIPLLQRNDVTFIRKSGCVSCHNDSLTAMTVAAARKQGLAVDETAARAQRKVIAEYIETAREDFLEGSGIAGGTDSAGYILFGLSAEGWPADPATDAVARYLKNKQQSDGSWLSARARPPIESSDIQSTATALRAIQVYGLQARRAEYEKAVELAGDWLARSQAVTGEDRAFQILGLLWAGKRDRAKKAAADLLRRQRSDGGWAQTAVLESDAYATGQALVALKESGVLKTRDSAYRRGAEFLLRRQREDGSWYVRSRSFPAQPYFESGFPYGHDQFISVAATNWAAMALVPIAR